MDYISTRGKAAKVSAAEAIVKGLADDGGLYVPETIPAYFPANLSTMDYNSLAKEIFALYLSDFSAAEIDELVEKAYGKDNFPDGPIVTSSLGMTEVLELWHGPTSAFKDMALQMLPHLLLKSLAKTGGEKEIVILVATSGDTGTAALEGFSDVPHTKIIVFYPKEGVSQIQELQMNTTAGANTSVIGVRGNFDDCQTGVKQIFADKELAATMAEQGKYFSSANSINWGRLLPQIVYYFAGYGNMVAKERIKPGDKIDIVVPTGNFGNILAGWYAMKMGLPVHNFFCASNRNNVLTEAIEKGNYNRQRPFYKTMSPSMDILISSNFERFVFDISGNDSAYTAAAFEQIRNQGSCQLAPDMMEKYSGIMQAGFAEEFQCRNAILEVFDAYGYLMDPHTAVGHYVAERIRGHNSGGYKLMLVSTASAYKFPAAVLKALNALPEDMEETDLPAVLAEYSGTSIPQNLAHLDELPIRHDEVCESRDMTEVVKAKLGL